MSRTLSLRHRCVSLRISYSCSTPSKSMRCRRLPLTTSNHTTSLIMDLCGLRALDTGLWAVTTECTRACLRDVCHYRHYHCHYCHSCHHCHYKGRSSTTAIATMSSWSIHYCLNHCFFDSFIRSNITSQVQWNTSQVQWDGRISNRPTVIGAPESTKGMGVVCFEGQIGNTTMTQSSPKAWVQLSNQTTAS